MLFYFGVTDISGPCVVLKACEDDGSAKAAQERLEGVVRVCVRVCVLCLSSCGHSVGSPQRVTNVK